MKVLTLHVETSDDGQTIYAELADILETLAMQYPRDLDAYEFLTACATCARSLESQSLARKKAGL